MSIPWNITFDQPTGDKLRLILAGNWSFTTQPPDPEEVVRRIGPESSVRHISFDTTGITSWDTGLLTFLYGIFRFGEQRNIVIVRDGLPAGALRLLKLAGTKPEENHDDRSELGYFTFLKVVGENSIALSLSTGEILSFIGKVFVSMIKTFTGKARFRLKDLSRIVEDVGAHALPIVTLISILVGMTLAFVGAVQLEMFNAELYVADLVGIGMAREMGAMMTGIIIAGRTGAAFAAELGTMKVNEETDALETLGVSPMEYLVTPRILALVLMTPLLVIYSDAMGIIGGAIVGATMLDISPTQYFIQTQSAVGVDDLMVGFIKAAVFGFIVALSGCLRGIQCGRSSEAVGLATTSAVVTAIVFIVVADSLLTIIFTVTGL